MGSYQFKGILNDCLGCEVLYAVTRLLTYTHTDYFIALELPLNCICPMMENLIPMCILTSQNKSPHRVPYGQTSAADIVLKVLIIAKQSFSVQPALSAVKNISFQFIDNRFLVLK